MRPHVARKLAEVEASYRLPHRCGLQTCQDDGECGFPARCVALPSDLSDDGEAGWRQEGFDNGWKAPERRVWWKRLPVIRHIAALRMSWQVHTYAGAWADVGIGIGGPNPHDLWVVEGAYHGYW